MAEIQSLEGSLREELSNAVGWAEVSRTQSVLSVLLPSVRYSHDHILVTVHATEAGFRITDAGELRSVFGNDTPELVRRLACAGAGMRVDDTLVVSDVEGRAGLVGAVLSFAYYLAAAPVTWHALSCDAEAVELVSKAEPMVKRMANAHRASLIERCGKRYSPYLKLDRRVTGFVGMSAVVPLVAVPPIKHAVPRLIATFIDTGASTQAVVAAERQASYVLDVTRELHVPKFVVVKGEDHELHRFAAFFDRDNVTVAEQSDIETVAASLAEAFPALQR